MSMSPDPETSRFRQLRGPAAWLWSGLLLSMTVMGILFILSVHMYFGWTLFQEQYVGLFFALVLAGVFLGVPGSKGAPRDRLPWYDLLLAVMGLAVGLYIAVFYPQIVLELGYLTPARVVLGSMAILLVLEALRRMLGWVLVIIVSVFLAYSFAAPHLPGPLKGTSTTPANLANYLYMDPNSMLSLLSIAATIAMAFLLFGQVLLTFGGADILNDLAFALFGRYRGGPAKAAVVGSSLVGTVTGGPVTNVMLTGSVTIPMMIRNGYRREVAGAIEAVASSGGQIMPPVMGVAAFLIADYLGVSYPEVVIAAFIPAVLYYICLYSQVDLLAARSGMRGLPASQMPSLARVLRTGWVILPALGALIYTILIARYTPSTAGVLSAGLALPFLLLRPGTRSRFFGRVLEALTGTGKMLLEVSVVLAAAGLIVGVTGITGLGFNMALALTQVGGQSLLLLLIVSAVVCVILGMGMPSVAAYTLVAVLVAPAMVKLGVLPMAAHLFIFYFAIVSNFTPPVALACFAAAPLAGANANRVGYEAIRLGIVAYLVPFLFVYSPALIMVGDVAVIIVSVITAILGSWLLAVGLVGYLFRSMSPVVRLLVALAGAALLVPLKQVGGIGWIPNLAGLALAGLLLAMEWRHRSARREPAATS